MGWIIGSAQGASYLYGGAAMYLDTSDVHAMISKAQMLLTKAQFQRLIARTVKEASNSVRSGVKQFVPHYYEVDGKWAQKQVLPYKLKFGMLGGVQCVIPLRGHKGVLGPQGTFMAKQGLRIVADIMKKNQSELPTHLPNQGDNPPFIATMTKTNGYTLVMTRKTKNRFPIVRVAALALPQMVMNQAGDDIMDKTMQVMADRLEHNFKHMFLNGTPGW